MQYNRLGQSGLLVSELCLGTMLFGENSQRTTSAEDAYRIMDRYVSVGGNFIDTANVYADGRSEEIIGTWLKRSGRRDEIVLATKVRFNRGPHPNAEGLSRFHIMTEVEQSLRRLKTETIDLYYLHMWDHMTPIEETLRALHDLVTTGKVRYIGVSNFTAWQVMKALAASDASRWPRFIAAQYQYSLVERSIEYEFPSLLQSEGVGLLPWGPLGGGFLTGKYKRDKVPNHGRIANSGDDVEEAWWRRNTPQNWDTLDVMGEIGQTYGKTVSQVALAWLKAKPYVPSVVIGPRTPGQLDDNLGVADWSLPSDDVAWLDSVSLPPDMYPYRMIGTYGASRGGMG